MALVTRQLTNVGHPLYSPSGILLSGKTVTFKLVSTTGVPVSPFDVTTGERVAGEVSVVTNVAGEFTINLWPNDRGSRTTLYLCSVDYPGVDQFTAQVPSGVAALNWIDFKLSGAVLTPGEVTALNAHIADLTAHGGLNETPARRNAGVNQMSTSLITGCTLSVNTDTTKFNIAAGTLRFINSYTDPLNAVFNEITYAGATAVAVTNLTTQDSSYVSIDSAGTIYQTLAKPSGADLKTKVLLGALVHTSHTAISSADSLTEVVGFDVAASVTDISLAVGPVNSGNLYSGNSTNTLRINKSLGTLTQTGINWKNSKQNPNMITCAASTGATFLATWRNGAGGWTTLPKTDIIPGRYDDGTGGATQPNGVVLNNKWSLIKLFYLPNSQLTGVEFGQAIYGSEAEAEAAKSAPTIDNPALAGVPFRGWIIVRGGATNLTLSTDAVFLDAGKFGLFTSGAGTGSSTTTMQGAYDNSVQPQVTTSTTGGAVQVRRGSTADTDKVFEVQNGAGAAIFSASGVDISLAKTITAAGTTGAQTINKPAGSVNFAAGASSLVVTNSIITTSSVIICTPGTNDATLKSAIAVANSGSFTIVANAAATAETRVNFIVTN